MKKLTFILTIFGICLGQCLLGQYNQERLFPDLSGDDLMEEVVSKYKATIQFFDYGVARDTMFREVYAVNDSLECVYSGHTLYMDPSKDPTTFVYMNGSDNGINTEHTYPRSKGASTGNPFSDMHHLFPTRAIVNEERSNFPFGEISDDETRLWFWKNQTLSSKPTLDIDEYSEVKWQKFEPRESFKGNIARAVIYFYTMYKAEADAEDPDFFWDMLPELCQWHFEDPVDSAEYARTQLIAKWQQYPNPFILDCSLVSRIYCTEIEDQSCEFAVPTIDVQENTLDLVVHYNSFLKQLTVNIESENLEDNYINIYTSSGRLVKSFDDVSYFPFELDVSGLSSGAYVVQVQSKYGVRTAKFFKS